MTNYLDLSSFERKRNEVLSFIEKTEAISNEIHATESKYQLEELIKLLEREHFNLTVVGEFSQGKSTFINALLGRKILPSKVKPTTAMINRIHYAEAPTFTLKFREETKSSQVLSEKEFTKLTAPREPDEDDPEDLSRYEEEVAFFQSVATAEIGYPNALCEAGVEIFDTPGTNDVDVAREEITYLFVPKSDAVIFLLSGTTPFGASEEAFLRDRILSEHIEKVFFVVNFKDRIQTVEMEEEVLNYTREKLENILPNPKIYLVSSLDALTIRRLESGEEFRVRRQRYKEIEETGFDVLEKELSHFLQYEKGDTKLRRPLMNLQEINGKLVTDAIPLRIAASRMELGEIKQRIEALQPKLGKFQAYTDAIIKKLSDGLVGEQTHLIRDFRLQLTDMREVVLNSLDRYEGSFDKEDVEEYIKQASRSQQRKMTGQMKQSIETVIKYHLNDALKQLDAEEKELNEAVRDVFDLNLTMNDSLTFKDMPTSTNHNLVVGFTLGTIGLFGAVGAAIAAAPILALGGVVAAIRIFGSRTGRELGVSALDKIDEYLRQKEITKFKEVVQKNFNKTQVDAVNAFKNEWQEIVRKVRQSFSEEVKQKINLLREELYQIRLESEFEKKSLEEKRARYEQLSKDVQDIQRKTAKMLEEMTF